MGDCSEYCSRRDSVNGKKIDSVFTSRLYSQNRDGLLFSVVILVISYRRVNKATVFKFLCLVQDSDK